MKLLIFSLLVLIQDIYGHSYVTNPITRSNQRVSTTGCKNECGPCDPGIPSSNPPAIARGATIEVQWPRNNHPAGFVRYAWTPTANSGSSAAFDAGVDSYFCFEIPGTTCKADNWPSDPLGGDTGGQFNCGNTITVPAWVSDGKWTVQWSWFGGIYNLGEYRSCIDYQVSGGTAYDATIPTPTFYGGDVSYPSENVCKFANVNTPHACNESCYGPYPSGQAQKGVPNAAFILPSTGSTASATATTASATSASATSASATSAAATSASATSAAATSASATSASATSTASATSASATSAGATSFILPPRLTTSPNDFAFIQGPSPGMCPNPDALNINGDILHPPKCGTSYPNSRCPDGQCCDQFGDCGPIPDADGQYRGNVGGVTQVVTYEEALQTYCTNNQGNWAYIACSNNANVKVVSLLVIIAAALL